jgi:hypothetical protein
MMLGVVLIFVMGLSAGFLMSDFIKEIWPKPTPTKFDPEKLSALIAPELDTIRKLRGPIVRR